MHQPGQAQPSLTDHVRETAVLDLRSHYCKRNCRYLSRSVFFLLQHSPQRASFKGQRACGGRMVLTGYVTQDLVVIHHRHCNNTKLVTQSRRGRRKRGTEQISYSSNQSNRCRGGASYQNFCLYTQRKLEKENPPEVSVPIRPYRDILQTFLTACPVL